MARYYYDRYRVNSSISWRWSKYEVDRTLVYVQGEWEAETHYGVYDSFSGGSGYEFDSTLGAFFITGSRTIYPGDTAYVYTSDAVGVYRVRFSTAGNKNVYRQYRVAYADHFIEERGDYISSTYASYSYKQNNQVNTDGYWWIRGSSSTNYYRGSYIDTIIAEDGTYPDNGRVGTSYWYIKRGRAFPELNIKVNGDLKTSDDGWVKVDGVLKPIEQIWTKIDDILKEV